MSIASPKWGAGGGDGRGSVDQVHVLSSPDTSLTCDASNTGHPLRGHRVNATLHGDSDLLCGI